MNESPFKFAAHSDVITPKTVAEVAEAITDAAQHQRRVLIIGGGTAWDTGHHAFIGAHPDHMLISTSELQEIVEYDPAELTLTARAGTLLADVKTALAEHDQYLPFDPPFAAAGATLGGVVAAGLTGSRRMHYGGLRDFILGIEFVNAAGQVVRGGGKVVKNAAGYDLPKLFCGSMGSLGIITEVSFKVFPQPPDQCTVVIGVRDAAEVAKIFQDVQRSPIEISAADAWTDMDALPNAGLYTVAIQIEGMTASFDGRLAALRKLLPAGASVQNVGDSDQLWEALTDLHWIGTQETVLRLYLPSGNVPKLDTVLAANGAQRVYSGAGNTVWAALNGDPTRLSADLARCETRAAVWRSPVPAPDILPDDPGAPMVQRIRQAFDPSDRFYSSPQPVRS